MFSQSKFFFTKEVLTLKFIKFSKMKMWKKWRPIKTLSIFDTKRVTLESDLYKSVSDKKVFALLECQLATLTLEQVE